MAALVLVLVPVSVLGFSSPQLVGNGHRSAESSRSIGIDSRDSALPPPTPSPPEKLSGSYRRDNGVTMTMSFRSRWRGGVRHPYCEDGSLWIRPAEGHQGRPGLFGEGAQVTWRLLDPAACPGSLQGTDLKGAGAVRAIYGATLPIARPIKAGTTAVGVVEYSIRDSARTVPFQIRAVAAEIAITWARSLSSGERSQAHARKRSLELSATS